MGSGNRARCSAAICSMVFQPRRTMGRPRASRPTTVPAPVLAGIAHGELLALSAFGSADGVVARGVSRLVTIASGLDPHGLGVPEVYWLRRADEYRSAVAGFASGHPEAVGVWLTMCCRALEDGAREALSIAEAAAQ